MNDNQKIKGIEKGEVITGDLLSSMADGINRNTKAFAAPRRDKKPKSEPNTEIGGGGSVGDEVFNSTTVTESTQISTDSNGDTISLERVDTIVLTEATSGRTMTLNITYPT